MLNDKNVAAALDKTIAELKRSQEEVAAQITSLAAEKKWEGIQEETKKAQLVQGFTQRVKQIKHEWERFTGLNVTEPVEEELDIPVEERTKWVISGHKVRVETEGGNTTYSNIVPRNLFVTIAMQAYHEMLKSGAGQLLNGYVKTSHVLNVMKPRIMALSDYKSESSVRLPIYVTFKVLVKEGFFTKESHKYRIPPGKEDAFKEFLNKMDLVTKEEAVRRLHDAGKSSMADALDNYQSDAQTSQGWDGAVIGEDGKLYKEFGPEMRRIIWPYKYKNEE